MPWSDEGFGLVSSPTDSGGESEWLCLKEGHRDSREGQLDLSRRASTATEPLPLDTRKMSTASSHGIEVVLASVILARSYLLSLLYLSYGSSATTILSPKASEGSNGPEVRSGQRMVALGHAETSKKELLSIYRGCQADGLWTWSSQRSLLLWHGEDISKNEGNSKDSTDEGWRKKQCFCTITESLDFAMPEVTAPWASWYVSLYILLFSHLFVLLKLLGFPHSQSKEFWLKQWEAFCTKRQVSWLQFSADCWMCDHR